MSKIFTVLKWVWCFVSGVAGLIRHRSALNNTPEMKAAKERQITQTESDEVSKTISDRDTKQYENDIAEH